MHKSIKSVLKYNNSISVYCKYTSIKLLQRPV